MNTSAGTSPGRECSGPSSCPCGSVNTRNPHHGVTRQRPRAPPPRHRDLKPSACGLCVASFSPKGSFAASLPSTSMEPHLVEQGEVPEPVGGPPAQWAHNHFPDSRGHYVKCKL